MNFQKRLVGIVAVVVIAAISIGNTETVQRISGTDCARISVTKFGKPWLAKPICISDFTPHPQVSIPTINLGKVLSGRGKASDSTFCVRGQHGFVWQNFIDWEVFFFQILEWAPSHFDPGTAKISCGQIAIVAILNLADHISFFDVLGMKRLYAERCNADIGPLNDFSVVCLSFGGGNRKFELAFSGLPEFVGGLAQSGRLAEQPCRFECEDACECGGGNGTNRQNKFVRVVVGHMADKRSGYAQVFFYLACGAFYGVGYICYNAGYRISHRYTARMLRWIGSGIMLLWVGLTGVLLVVALSALP
jgi:hypothetical protein